MLHNAADVVELSDVCRTKLKLPYQTDSDAALLPDLIHQLKVRHKSGAASGSGLSLLLKSSAYFVPLD